MRDSEQKSKIVKKQESKEGKIKQERGKERERESKS